MITIIISACQIANGGVCRDFSLPLEQAMDAEQCVMFAPPHFGEWAENHPGWRITKWRCTGAGSDPADKDI